MCQIALSDQSTAWFNRHGRAFGIAACVKTRLPQPAPDLQIPGQAWSGAASLQPMGARHHRCRRLGWVNPKRINLTDANSVCPLCFDTVR